MQRLSNINVLLKYNVYYTSVICVEMYAYHMSKLCELTKREHLSRQHPPQETETEPFFSLLLYHTPLRVTSSQPLTNFSCVQILF